MVHWAQIKYCYALTRFRDGILIADKKIISVC